MFALTIQEKGGDAKRMVFGKAEVTIGRVKGNDIILAKGNVSKEHARIILKDGKFIVIDRKSTNGTFVNGRKITGPLVVKESDKIYIGDFLISVDESSVDENDDAAARAATSGLDGDVDYSAPAMNPAPPPAAAVARPPTLPPLARPVVSSLPPSAATSPAAAALDPIAPAPAPTVATPDFAPLPAAVVAPVPPPSVLPPPPVASPISPVALGVNSGPIANPAVAPISGPRRNPPTAPPPLPQVPGFGARTARVPRPVAPAGVYATVPPLDKKTLEQLALQARVIERVRRGLGDTTSPAVVADPALWQKAERAIADVVGSMDAAGEVPSGTREALAKGALNEVLGLGPLDDLLADEAVTDIVIDRSDRVIVKKANAWTQSGRGFSSDAALRDVLVRLALSTGQITKAHPLIEVRLRDGTRMSATLAPLSVAGASAAFRKARRTPPTLDQLVKQKVLAANMAGFLTAAVRARRNILVCGAPGAGTTSVLSALAEACPAGERIVTVEDIGEITLSRDEWVALESWPGDQEGAPVTVAQLVGAALRLRPDRLVVGDVRGREANDLCHALSGPVDGALLGLTAPSAAAAMARLAALAGPDVSSMIVTQAIDLIVTVTRHSSGLRIAAIDEVTDGGEPVAVFAWTGAGFTASGHVPRFVGELEPAGIVSDAGWFK